MIKTKWWAAFGMALALAACGGGGGDAGDSPFDDTPDEGVTTVADLSLVLNKNSIANGGSDTVTATVTAVDANRVAVPDATVTIGADSGAVVVSSSATTDDNGQVTATISNGTDKTNRTVTVTATAGGLTRTATFVVAGATLSATGATLVAPSAAGSITYRVVDSASTAITGTPITITAPGLTDVNGVTDNNGEFVYNFTAPATSGPLDITATAAGVTLVRTLTVQTGSVPTAPLGSVTSASISVDPSVVRVGGDRAEVRALFLGVNNAPVQNIRVRFDLAGDPNSIGGTITSGTDYVYSSQNGVALSAYQPGSRASPTDGVIVRACWDYNDFAAGTCPNQVTKTLTVTSDALSVSLGYDNTISTGPSGLTYIKRFVVTVNDAAGQAKADVLVTPSVDLLTYYKGRYTKVGARWEVLSDVACPNEDLNRNGVLEAYEDFNTNGDIDPRKADVLIRMVGSNRTSSDGTAILQIEYLKNVATWLDYKILVTAGAVTGTEGRVSVTLPLEGAESEFTATVAPSFAVSPYGISQDPRVDRLLPDGTTLSVCTNPN
jgi:hypothetical protein